VRLDPSRLNERLAQTPYAGKVFLHDRLDSTNDECRRLAAQGAPEGTVVLAEEQTAGRGRQGRHWHSAAGCGLYLSVLFRPRAPLSFVTRWTLGVSLAAAEACRNLTDAEIRIKWPNDLVHEGRKIAGILAELRSAGQHGAELVVGTGINVGLTEQDLPAELAGVATSLRVASGRSMLDREELAVDYLERLWGVAQELHRNEWDAIAGRWLALSPESIGARVRVLAGNATGEGFEGRTAGIDEAGALRVRRADARIVCVSMPQSVVLLEE